MIKLMHGDCIAEMQKMESGIIDLTVTSPPYDNLRTYAGTLDWSFEIFQQVANELYRITKNGGVVVWVVGDATIKGSETGTSFRQALYFREIGFNLHDTMIYYTNKPPMNHNRYEQKFEYMFILTKDRPKTFNPIMVNTNTKGKNTGAALRNGDFLKKRSGATYTKDKKLLDNIWYLPRSSKSGDVFSKKHPATFPEQLAHNHIISWSNENDIVFDPFMGSGTTGKMAKLNNRKFIGIEKVSEYFNIAKNRIKFQ
jgi:DNA modification methylase